MWINGCYVAASSSDKDESTDESIRVDISNKS